VLADAGVGFDCASKNEIQQVLGSGVAPQRIVYAHPCKSITHLRFAKSVGVKQTVFDNEDEVCVCRSPFRGSACLVLFDARACCCVYQLHKVKAEFPDAQLILRLRTDDSKSVCQLSNKYGANLEDVPQLLDTAKALGLNVVGISYHVGSGCSDINSYGGMKLTLLDIGGGFPGSGSDTSLHGDGVAKGAEGSPNSFVDIAGVIRSNLARLFPEGSGVRVIAEPGRFFVEGAFALCASIISRRTTQVPAASTGSTDLLVPGSLTDLEPTGAVSRTRQFHASPLVDHTRYYINDSVYGSFNCIMYDHAHVKPTPLPQSVIGSPLPDFRAHLKTGVCAVGEVAPPTQASAVSGPVTDSSIWGQTCDGIDLVVKHIPLPQMNIGDWMCFENMGAYTMAAGGTFNGFQQPSVFYVDDEGDVESTEADVLEKYLRDVKSREPVRPLP
jgi:ornithine decarboxylase